MKKLVLIDGHSLAYRMYFALERTAMKTSQGQATWGVYGFFKALFDLIQRYQPEGLLIAFDMGRETFRNALYPDYKAHREAMPEGLKTQMLLLREGIALLGIPVFELSEFEADDLIGTLAQQAANSDIEALILTGDQDAFQIIDDARKISVLLPSSKDGLVQYTREKVYEKWGVFPEQVTDFKGLKGDTSDNIPGVPGIGDKTAAKLLAQYTTLETVLEHTAELNGAKLKESLVTYKDQAILSKLLATIRYDAPVVLEMESCIMKQGSIDGFLEYLKRLEFRSFITQAHTLLQPFHSENAVPLELQQTLLTKDNVMLSSTILPEADLTPHQVIQSLPALEAFLLEASRNSVLAIDLETTGLDFLTADLVGIALATTDSLKALPHATDNPLGLTDFAHERLELVQAATEIDSMSVCYIPLMHPEPAENLNKNQVLSLLKPLLSDPQLVKVAHNAKFERNLLQSHGVEIEGLFLDTMIMSHLVDEERRHGLKALAFDLLGLKMQDISELIGKGKSQITFNEVSLEIASPYAAQDAAATLRLAHYFAPHFTGGLAMLLYELELPTTAVLCDMERAGVSLDVPYLKTLESKLQEHCQRLESEIFQLAGLPFNLNSPKQVGDILFDRMNIPARGMTPTKSGYSTNAKVLESLADEYPIVKMLLEYRQFFKLKSTYVEALPELIHPLDKRIHTSFNQAITATGRLSSSDPNLQNIPIRSEMGRSIRQAFVPKDPEHFVILSADYSQIELRLLAHFSQDERLIEAFQNQIDVHKATAALVFGVPLSEVTKEMRYQAKAVNFGIIYGQTAFGLSNGLGIAPKEAAEFIDKYFSQYPKVKHYIQSVKQHAHETGVVQTLYGRVKRVAEGLSQKNKSAREFTERAAFNMPLQGTAADLVKMAMIKLSDAIQREALRSRLILQVHDEVVLEVYQPELEQVKQIVTEAMSLGQPLRVPLEIDISVGPSWLETEVEEAVAVV
jgi:DNA polymerase I